MTIYDYIDGLNYYNLYLLLFILTQLIVIIEIGNVSTMINNVN